MTKYSFVNKLSLVRDGVLVLVLVLTRVVFPVLSNTQYSAKFLSTSTRTYSSIDAKSPVLMSILRVQMSTLLKSCYFILKRLYF